MANCLDPSASPLLAFCRGLGGDIQANLERPLVPHSGGLVPDPHSRSKTAFCQLLFVFWTFCACNRRTRNRIRTNICKSEGFLFFLFCWRLRISPARSKNRVSLFRKLSSELEGLVLFRYLVVKAGENVMTLQEVPAESLACLG